MDVALKLSFCICSFKNTNTKWLRKGITCYCTEKKKNLKKLAMMAAFSMREDHETFCFQFKSRL